MTIKWNMNSHGCIDDLALGEGERLLQGVRVAERIANKNQNLRSGIHLRN